MDDDDSEIPACTDKWKAGAAEHQKRALKIYDTTGLFAGACRHGFVLASCEMVRSGELAKYPLALTNHFLDTLGNNLTIGYDIGCGFQATVAKSAALSSKARSQGLRLTVNSFHGYAHNRLCQLSHHPLYLSGYGLEDMETLERVFSASNQVARTIRHASAYHWHQFVDLHFQQWNEDKYERLGKFPLLCPSNFD